MEIKREIFMLENHMGIKGGRKRMRAGRGGINFERSVANLLRFHKTAMEVKPFHSFTSTIQQIHILFTHGSITKWTVPSAIASIPGSPA